MGDYREEEKLRELERIAAKKKAIKRVALFSVVVCCLVLLVTVIYIFYVQNTEEFKERILKEIKELQVFVAFNEEQMKKTQDKDFIETFRVEIQKAKDKIAELKEKVS